MTHQVGGSFVCCANQLVIALGPWRIPPFQTIKPDFKISTTHPCCYVTQVPWTLAVRTTMLLAMAACPAASCPVLAWRATMIPPQSLSTRVARWQLQVLVARPWEWVLLPQVLLP